MFHFYGEEPEKFQAIKRAFRNKARNKPFGPIGDPMEAWYLIFQVRGVTPIKFHGYLLIFSDWDLAEKFCVEAGLHRFDPEGFVIRRMAWKEILSWCYGEDFYGAVVDWLVRENYTFHRLE